MDSIMCDSNRGKDVYYTKDGIVNRGILVFEF